MRIVSDQEPMRWIKIHLLCRDYRPEEGVIDLACVNYDISELKRTEEELREARSAPRSPTNSSRRSWPT